MFDFIFFLFFLFSFVLLKRFCFLFAKNILFFVFVFCFLFLFLGGVNPLALPHLTSMRAHWVPSACSNLVLMVTSSIAASGASGRSSSVGCRRARATANKATASKRTMPQRAAGAAAAAAAADLPLQCPLRPGSCCLSVAAPWPMPAAAVATRAARSSPGPGGACTSIIGSMRQWRA